MPQLSQVAAVKEATAAVAEFSETVGPMEPISIPKVESVQ